MTDVEEEIKELAKIIDETIRTTPNHLRGLLIPDKHIDRFLHLCNYMMGKARDSEKYFKMMMEGEAVREQMKLELVTKLCKHFATDDKEEKGLE